MPKTSKKNTKGNQGAIAKSKSLAIAAKGITTGQDYANFMSALMSDIISGKVAPTIGNAACKAGSNLLKVVEMQMRYGSADNSGKKVLNLALQAPLVDQVQ